MTTAEQPTPADGAVVSQRSMQELLLDRLNEKRRLAAEAYRKRVADAEMSAAFLNGDQWIEYTWSQGIRPVDNPTNETRETENIMLPAYERWLYYLFKERPVITAFAGGRELRDIEAAAVASAICDHLESNNGWAAARRQQAAWAAVAGVGYIVPVWRDTARTRTRVSYRQTEEPVENADGTIAFVAPETTEEREGDIAFEAYSPLQTYLLPLDANEWPKVREILTVDVVSAEWIRDHFEGVNPADLKPVTLESLNLAVLERINAFASPEFGLGTNTTSREDRYLVLQWFQRPTRDHADGRLVVSVGDRIVRDDVLPYIAEAREVDPADTHNLAMGVIPFFPGTAPGALFPPAPVGQWRKTQIRLNRLLTAESTNRHQVVKNKLLVEKNTLAPDAWTNADGEIIELKPGASIQPRFIQAPPLAGIQAEKEDARAAFNDITGQQMVLQGRNPPQVRAAHQLDILRDEAMTLVFAVSEQFERAYELTARFVLAMARRRYSRERILEICGQDMAGAALTYESAVIPYDIRVKRGSMLPRNYALRNATLLEWFRYGLFVDQNTGKQQTEQVMDMMEWGTLERTLSPRQRQRNRAQYEAKLMLRDRQVVRPWEHEDHAVHIECHQADLARPEWYDADDAVQAIMLAHLEEHRQFEAAAVAPEAMTAMDPVAGLGGSAVPAAQGAAASPAGPPSGQATAERVA